VKILAIDGSLTATGMAVVHVGKVLPPACLDSAFIATEPDAKAKHTYQADKDGLRVDALIDVLLAMLDMHRPDVVAVESPAGSQHANSAKALGLVYGAIRGTLRARGITPIMVQAHHAKAAATGDQHATKSDVVTAMAARFPEANLSDRTNTKKRREAVADALSVACGALAEPTVQALVRASA
jgi:crossover junction endodeoxyribonuclease RuvC